VLGGALALTIISGFWGEPRRVSSHPEAFIFIVIVPLLEEIVFRLGFGEFFRRKAGDLWGAYFSALLFALVHTLPTPANLFSLQIGLPLGPFLLGIINERLYIKSSSL